MTATGAGIFTVWWLSEQQRRRREEEKAICPRCGESIKKDSPIPSESEIAEIVDKYGKVLIIHVNCIRITDKVA